MTRFFAAVTAVLFPLFAFALDLSTFNPDDPTSLIGAIFDAFKNGNIGLAIVLTLMVVIAIIRKIPVAATFVKSDLGGTAFTFGFAVLVMLAGPLSTGAVLSVAVVKTAVLTAMAASGGWTIVKRLVLDHMGWLNENIFSKIPIVGWIVATIAKRWASGEKVSGEPINTNDPSPG